MAHPATAPVLPCPAMWPATPPTIAPLMQPLAWAEQAPASVAITRRPERIIRFMAFLCDLGDPSQQRFYNQFRSGEVPVLGPSKIRVRVPTAGGRMHCRNARECTSLCRGTPETCRSRSTWLTRQWHASGPSQRMISTDAPVRRQLHLSWHDRRLQTGAPYLMVVSRIARFCAC